MGEVDAGTRRLPTDVELDLRGEVCPYTFLRAKLALEDMAPGELLRVAVDNPGSAHDVPRSLTGAGHAVLAVDEVAPGRWVIAVRKGGSGAPA